MPTDPYGDRFDNHPKPPAKKKVVAPRPAVSPQPTRQQRAAVAAANPLDRYADDSDARATALRRMQPSAQPASTTPSRVHRTDTIFDQGGQLASAAMSQGFRSDDSFTPFHRGQQPVGHIQTPRGPVAVYRKPSLSTGFDPRTGWSPEQEAEAARLRRQNLGGTAATARGLVGGLTGYTPIENAIHSGHSGQTAKGLAEQAVWFFPWLRGPRAVMEGIRAIEAGAGARAAVGAGRESLRGPGPIRGAFDRTFRHEGASATIPAARSRTGRAIENLADLLRPVVSKTGLQKTESERFGQEFGRSKSYRQKTQQAAAVALTRVGRKLDDTQQYALRIVKEGVSPQTRLEHHVQLAANAQHDEEVLYHSIHATLTDKAQRWIKLDAEGRPVLKTPEDFVTRADKKAAARLNEASDILSKVAQSREDIYRQLNRLTDQQIADRIMAPGRVYQGARWKETNAIIEDNLAKNPIRQQLLNAVEKQIGEGPQADGIMHLLDAKARRFAQETGNPEVVDEFFNELAGVAHMKSPLPADMEHLYATAPEMPDMPDTIPSSDIASEILKAGHKLPPEIATHPELTNAINSVYNLTRAGAQYKDWYYRAGQVVRQVAEWEGFTPKEVAQLTAIYSQSATPTANMAFVVKALREFKDTGRIESLGAGGAAQRAKAQSVLEGHDWQGRKTNSFYANIAKYVDPAEHVEVGSKPVTVDRWVVRMFAPKSKKIVPGVHYDAMEHAIQMMADHLGWHPEEVQAAAWVTAKAQSLMERYPGWSRERAEQEAADAYERGASSHSAPGQLFQTDPQMIRAAVVQAQMMGGTDEAIAQTAKMFGVPEAELRSAMGDNTELDRILSNREVWKEHDPKYQQSRNDAKAGDDLNGLPTINGVKWRSNADAQRIASDYMGSKGLPYDPPRTYAKVDRERASRIADWYDKAADGSDDPTVRKAYEAMARETLDQYHSITKAGYTFEFYPGVDPYPGGPREAMMDLRDSKHLYVFPTEEGYGHNLEGLNKPQHPLLGDSGVIWNGKNVTHNDIFRAVHDFFGHFKEGVGFRADGEENAWRAHSAMYSPEARRAMTSETRGQNSWVNYGPHGAVNRTADQASTYYADQKAVLAPDWVVNDGAGDTLHQGAEDFHEDAARELESHAAFARDIGRTIPKEDWPAWVRNQLRDQGLLHEDGSFNSAAYFAKHPSEGGSPIEPTSKSDHDAWVEEMKKRNRSPVDPLNPQNSADPERAMGELDKQVNKDVADTFPEDWLAQSSRAAKNDNFVRDILKDKPEARRAYVDAVQKGGFSPYEQGIFAAMRALPDLDPARQDLFRLVVNSPLFQHGILGTDRIGTGSIKGAISFDNGKAMIHLTQYADVSTFAHEIAHYVRRYKLSDRELKTAGRYSGATPIKQKINGRTVTAGYKWTRDAEESFARQFESYLRAGRSPNSQLTNTFRSISAELRDIYEHEDLPDVHPSLAKLFDRLLSPREVKGGRLVGAEDFNFGVDYIPYVRGVPATASDVRASVGAYIRSSNRLFGAGRRQAIGAGPDDIALRKTFKGALITSGFFKIDTTNASAKSLITASRLSAAHEARKGLLPAATDIPSDISDVAIKVDPKKNVSPKLKALWDRMDRADTGGVLISQKELDAIDFDLVEQARRNIFPADIDGRDVRTIAADAIDNQKPIENIKWVSRDVLDNSGLLYVPYSNRMAHSGLNKQIKRGVQGGLLTMDAVNDLQKALILYLNPAYIPVNLTGNLVMNAMQQGVFMPVNMWRSATMHQWLDVTERTLIDSHMGHGLTGSLSLRTTPGQLMHATLGHYINLAVDLIPRRSAWLHEARVQGFDSREKMKDLLQRALDGDEAAHRDMEAISRRANDAIVDYERMNPFEREVLARVIFFYPWLKGATRYSIRFIAEHPLQAAGLAMAADNAYSVSNEVLGDRPEYASLDVPISTRTLGLKVPGIGSVTAADAVGEHQWDERGYPMVFNPRQMLTFTTPLDIYRAGIGFITGDVNAPALVQNLVPFIYAAGVSLYGYDPFTNKEVPKGLHTFAQQLYGGVPVVDRFKKINMSDEERKSYQKVALNPRSRGEEIARLFGSSLAPAPYNPDIGEQRVHSSDPVWRLVHDSTQAGLGTPPPEVMKELDVHTRLTHALHKGMTPLEKAKTALPIYVAATGDHSFDHDVQTEKSEAAGQALYSAMREVLFPELNAWESQMDQIINANLEANGG